MARKNIFRQIRDEELDFCTEAKRILKLLHDKKGIKIEVYDEFDVLEDPRVNWSSIIGFVNRFSFPYWEHRGNCTNCWELQETLGLQDVDDDDYEATEDQMLSFLEMVLNILFLAHEAELKKNCIFEVRSAYIMAKQNTLNILSWLNHEAKELKAEKQVIVFEKNVAVSAVVEVVDDVDALSILRYGHHTLQGDIEAKKKILLKLAGDLEPKLEELKNINIDIKDDISFLYNNINLRHNNIDPKGKYYKRIVAEMNDKKLEDWYDILFNMILLANLMLKNLAESKKVSQLKSSIKMLSNA